MLAALGYFVLPVDVIPDFVLGLGFTDDIAVLTAAITAVSAHITPAHRLAAKAGDCRQELSAADAVRRQQRAGSFEKSNSCRFRGLQVAPGTTLRQLLFARRRGNGGGFQG